MEGVGTLLVEAEVEGGEDIAVGTGRLEALVWLSTTSVMLALVVSRGKTVSRGKRKMKCVGVSNQSYSHWRA